MIFLVGFMGSGKSTVATKLSERMALPLLEMDDEIEKLEAKSIKEIFANEGEEFFRQKETELLQSIKVDAVVSTGGGVVEREQNREALSIGKVIYLQASFETIIQRLSNDKTRPLWAGNEQEKKQKFERRQELYEGVADVVIEVDEKTPEEITEEIMHRLNG